MKKNYYFLLLTVVMLFAGKSFAQVVLPCYTDEMNAKYKLQHPEIAIYEKQLNDEIAAYIKNKRPNSLGRTSSYSPDNDSFYFDIPVVVHVMHSYSSDVINDKAIYALISEMNRFYSMNYDTSDIIAPFKKYIGIPRFRFHLALLDPNGNPTKGITHHYTYLAIGGGDQCKMDQWPPTSYLNIWFADQASPPPAPGEITVAYATQPPSAAANPFYDGIICNYVYINDTGNHAGGSIDHETGHIFNLYHTFGQTNDPQTANQSPMTGNCGCATCSDLVDDTPPTDGCLSCFQLYDTVCSTNYFVIYPSENPLTPGVDSIANYHDTAYGQDIMNYASNSQDEFTLGQIARMRAAANSSVGGRNNLWSPINLYATGIAVTDTSGSPFYPLNDLPPIVDFAVKNAGGNASGGTYTLFTCPGIQLAFINESYQDTVTSVTWTFLTGGSSIPETTATATTVIKPSFSNPGWVSLQLAATGNNTGTTTDTFSRAVFVADNSGTDANGYFMEFDNSDTAKWPMFNYYNNEFKWQHANVGYYDNSCIQYVGYDYRLNPTLGAYPLTGTPVGDFDDFFSMPMDLSSFSDTCNLNFYYSAASRSSLTIDENDTLEIDYSTDHTVSWHTLTKLAGNTLINKGALSIPYAPLWQGDWAPMTVGLPSAARTSYTIFRFRYKPNVTAPDPVTGFTYSSGNNYYMDRINFNRAPASVSNVKMDNATVVVAPNPTNGDAYVIINEATSTSAQVVVSDITGKTVYTTQQQFNGQTKIQIPHSAISVPGVYLIQTTTGSDVHTQKLVVE